MANTMADPWGQTTHTWWWRTMDQQINNKKDKNMFDIDWWCLSVNLVEQKTILSAKELYLFLYSIALRTPSVYNPPLILSLWNINISLLLGFLLTGQNVKALVGSSFSVSAVWNLLHKNLNATYTCDTLKIQLKSLTACTNVYVWRYYRYFDTTFVCLVFQPDPVILFH